MYPRTTEHCGRPYLRNWFQEVHQEQHWSVNTPIYDQHHPLIMKYSHSGFPFSREMLRPFMEVDVHYLICKSPRVDPLLNQMNQFPTTKFCHLRFILIILTNLHVRLSSDLCSPNFRLKICMFKSAGLRAM